ncbi:MAG: hypothetical protein KDA80_17390 [Planctomycetaceae bacterium]|nr:hypothetical protein [Planctomycetaceae bacterium]
MVNLAPALLFRLLFVCICLLPVGFLVAAAPPGVPESAAKRPDFSSDGHEAWVTGSEIYFVTREFHAEKTIVLPRLPCRMKDLQWQDPQLSAKLTLHPEPTEWHLRTNRQIAPGTVMRLELLDPVPKQLDLPTIKSGEDGEFHLPAHFAATHGKTLRYEPQPHKNTVGYWSNPEDWASWQVRFDRIGPYRVDILQGCGTGQGGSEVEVFVRPVYFKGDQGDVGEPVDSLKFVVEDTGHFQNFKRREIGEVTIPSAGMYQLEIRPRKKAKNAVMDVREVILAPAAAQKDD